MAHALSIPRRTVFSAILLCAAAATGAAQPSRLRPLAAEEAGAALRPAAGRARLVHLWASWCVPCVAELPEVVGFLRRHAAQVDVVTVALEEQSAGAERVLAHVGRLPGAAYVAPPGVMVPAVRASLNQQWDGSIPATFVVRDDGAVILSQIGITRLDEIQRSLAQIQSNETSTRRK